MSLLTKVKQITKLLDEINFTYVLIKKDEDIKQYEDSFLDYFLLVLDYDT